MCRSLCHNRFNSCTPGGVRPQSAAVWRRSKTFQFTHPGRGATSIGRRFDLALFSFNSRTPGGVRLGEDVAQAYNELFQFTHPGRGATDATQCERGELGVSIHAPREGCDSLSRRYTWRSSSFNSRTPGGVRLQGRLLHASCLMFQFTHPGRGATQSYSSICNRG